MIEFQHLQVENKIKTDKIRIGILRYGSGCRPLVVNKQIVCSIIYLSFEGYVIGISSLSWCVLEQGLDQ